VACKVKSATTSIWIGLSSSRLKQLGVKLLVSKRFAIHNRNGFEKLLSQEYVGLLCSLTSLFTAIECAGIV
jgi:hypothetical protein